MIIAENTLCLLLILLFRYRPATRLEGQEEKDAKASDDLQLASATGTQQTLQSNSISGITRTRRACCFSWAHADTGKYSEKKIFGSVLLDRVKAIRR